MRRNVAWIFGVGTGFIFLLSFVSAMAQETIRASQASDGTEANGYSFGASISADGRLVAFESSASNLALGGDNGFGNVYLHDRLTRETTLVSKAHDGGPSNGTSLLPCLSGRGDSVVFVSIATNLVEDVSTTYPQIYVRNLISGTTVLAGR